MMAALTSSRRKMFSKVRVTEVVPAPEEPVMAMMGCLMDMAFPSHRREEAALAEQGRVVAVVDQLFLVVVLDALHLFGRAEHEADALMQPSGLHFHQPVAPGTGHAACLFHQKGDGVG